MARTLRGLLALCGVLLLAGPASAALQQVWAVDDGEKIYQDDMTNPLKSGGGRNAVWDGSTVSLSSARNEIVAFQLILEADSAGASQVDVYISDLTNGTATIRGSHPLPAPNDYLGVGVELFTEHYLNVFDPSGSPIGGYFNWTAAACPNLTGLMPDALVPFSAAAGKGGAPFDIGANLNQGVWVDIYVAKGLPAGLYTGTVTVSVGGVTHSTLPLHLQVLNFDLPEENHYKSMVFYSRDSIRNRHNTGSCTSEMWETVQDYYRMAHRHRLDLIGCGNWDEITNLPGTLSGETFTAAHNYAGPGEGVGESLFSIATYGGWWGQDQTYYQTESDKWVNWFAANAPGVDYFLYLTDEPSPDVYPDIVTKASWIHDNPGPGHDLPVFVTKHPTDALVGSVDIWGDPTASYDLTTTAAARARGEDVYPYAAYRPKTPADVMDDWGIAYRLKPWIAHKVGISRWFTWESTHWSGNSNELDPGGPKNVWAYPFTFETSSPENNGNGDGTLFYPGRDFDFPEEDRNYPGPISSYRMKMYRRGAQDVEYMWLAEQAGRGAEVQQILQDLLPHVMDDALTVPDWSNADYPYDQARRELADLILGANRAPSARFAASPTRGAGPLTVTFTDLSTFTPTSWSWDFGDGATSTVQNPTHIYTDLGGHTVSLTVTNASGSTTTMKADCVTVTDEVIAYPDTWETQGGWADATLVSGSLDDVHNDDDVYMVTGCEPSSQRHSVLYYAHTGYTPDQIARITIEYQAKSSRSDNPGSMLAFVRPTDGNWSNGYMGNWSPTSADTWYTFEATDAAATMSPDGILGFELCACPSTANNYQISTDVMRFRLELAGAPTAPTAAFFASPVTGPPPLTVHFTDASSNAPTSWLWDFGDGSTATEQDPTHDYLAVGTYPVTLTATNAGGSDSETKAHCVRVTFLDLPEGSWALDHILACVDAGIVKGFRDGTYQPKGTVTRGQMAAFLARAMCHGEENVPTGPATPTFTDVSSDYTFYNHIEYAVSQGVVTGYAFDNTYRPSEPVTRGQMAAFLARALCGGEDLVPTGPATPSFPDVATDFKFYNHIEWIYANGITTGKSDGWYHPEEACLRDQMAVFISRAFLGMP